MLREKSLGHADHKVLVEGPDKQTETQLPPSKGSNVKVECLKITGFSEAAAIYDNLGSNLRYTGAL